MEALDQDRSVKDVINELVDDYLDGRIKCKAKPKRSPDCLKKDYKHNMFDIGTGWVCKECWNCR